jgi:ATP-dependent helicase/nuclease subunit B
LNGVIDRVDVFRDGENVYVRVVDYKTGSKTFSVSDISEGLNLQLLLYIFSLTKQKNKNIEKLFGGKPIAGAITYLSAASAKVKAERISDPDKSVSNAIADIKRTGLILDNDSVIEAISHSGDDRLLMKTARKNSFIDLQGLDTLYDTVCGVLTEIGNTMMSGNINAVPKVGSEHCKYCKYSFVCKASRKS